MRILPSGPLAVNVARSGGLLGRTTTAHAVADPATKLHRSAVSLLHAPPTPPPPSPSRDGFTYSVTIADAGGESLLEARYRDPVPDLVADLLTALASHATA